MRPTRGIRTTVPLDPDNMRRAKAASAKTGKPFKSIVNEAMRIGLDHFEQRKNGKPYRSRPTSMGMRPGFSLDNIGELLAQLEGEDYR